MFSQNCPLWARFQQAKYYHQAYRHGLLKHCLGVAQGVSAISATFPGIDRDVAVTGALLHDIGKLDAYGEDTQSIDLTDLGDVYTGRSRSATTGCVARSRTSKASPRSLPGPWGTSSSPITARSNTAAQSCPPRAKGDLGAHDRQSWRAPRQLRPDREGALAGGALVELRSSARDWCMVRRTPGKPSPPRSLHAKPPERPFKSAAAPRRPRCLPNSPVKAAICEPSGLRANTSRHRVLSLWWMAKDTEK